MPDFNVTFAAKIKEDSIYFTKDTVVPDEVLKFSKYPREYIRVMFKQAFDMLMDEVFDRLVQEFGVEELKGK